MAGSGDAPASVAALEVENARLRDAAREAHKLHADLRALIENTDDPILFSDADAKPVVWNSSYARAMKELLGLDMVAGFQPHSLLPAPERAFWERLHARVLGGEKFREEFTFDHDGETRFFEVAYNPVFEGDQVVGFSEYTHEVTAQKRIEVELRAAQQRAARDYQLLFDRMLDGVVIFDVLRDEHGVVNGLRFADVNPAFTTLSGIDRDAVVGRRLGEPFPLTAPDVWEHVLRVNASGESERFETYSSHFRMHARVDVFRPQVDQLCFVFQDVTHRRRLEEELRRAERLHSLGTLAGGIAHDFNNILTALLSSLELARWDVPQSGRAASMLKEAEQACVRATDLTRQLLTFARGGMPIKRPERLGRHLDEWVGFALRGTNVGYELRMPQDLWTVELDVGQINQVIHNLVRNAQQAMPDGGTVTVEAANLAWKDLERAHLASFPHEIEKIVRIRIEDTGVGIPEEAVQRIFDPYFSTKSEGSGLGLATSYSIVHNHGGTITVRSVLGEGTTFDVLLPALGAVPLVDAIAPPAPELTRGGGGRVLVMDDDPHIRETASRILRYLGYQPSVANDGEQALRLYREAMESGAPFALVILDLTIPGGLGGRQTMERLLQIDPEVRAIVSSGYSDDPVLARYREHGFAAVVNKPYRMEHLADVVREVLTAVRAP